MYLYWTSKHLLEGEREKERERERELSSQETLNFKELTKLAGIFGIQARNFFRQANRAKVIICLNHDKIIKITPASSDQAVGTYHGTDQRDMYLSLRS